MLTSTRVRLCVGAPPLMRAVTESEVDAAAVGATAAHVFNVEEAVR